jgi:hypothetical protein
MKQESSSLSENIVIRVSAKEKALMDKYARKEGWSLSEYVRATMLTDLAVMHGDIEAMKIIFGAAKEKMASRFDRKFRPLHSD